MFIHFDKNKLHIQLIVGSLEKYEPSEKIKEIQQKLDKLKDIVEQFQKNEVFPKLEEIDKLVSEENTKFSSPKE